MLIETHTETLTTAITNKNTSSLTAMLQKNIKMLSSQVTVATAKLHTYTCGCHHDNPEHVCRDWQAHMIN